MTDLLRLLPRHLRTVLSEQPWAVRLYHVVKPPLERRITGAIDAVRALQRQYRLGEVRITPEGGFFKAATGAEFAYLPAWGAYGAEYGQIHEEPELRYCVQRIPQGALVYDVGANVGTFSINLAMLRPDLRFRAFEPVASTFHWLGVNISRNRLTDRITAYRMAISDSATTVRVRNDLYTGNRITAGDAPNTDVVEARALDDVVATLGTPQFIKVDVEGAELHVIRGGTQLLRDAQPALLLEVVESHLKAFGGSIERLEGTLAQRGYAQPALPRFATSNRIYVAG